MLTLPPFCSTEGLFVPAVERDAAELLRGSATDALETLQSVGIPESWRAVFRAESVIRSTDRFQGWTTADGRRVGLACLVARNPIPMAPEAFEDWVVASDGRMLLCSSLVSDSVHFYNSDLSAFVVFVSALRAIPYLDEDKVFAVLPQLGQLDPAAFDESGAWGELCAERAFGDPAKDDEIERVRIAALGG